MKILFLITGLTYGGAETVTVNLAVDLKARGYDVVLVSMMKPLAFVEKLEHAGVKLLSLGINKKYEFVFSLPKIFNILKQERPDVVHTHMYHANIFSRWVKLFSGGNYFLVNTIHNTYEGGKLRKVANRITRRVPQLITQVSKLGLANYINEKLIDSSNSVFMPNSVNSTAFGNLTPVDIRADLQLPSNTFVFLAVGRLERQKDYPNLFKAVNWLKENTDRSFAVCIAGVGSLETQLKDLKHTMNLDNDVFFLGLRKDILSVMKGVDAFVMSSEWEGTPISLLEAMASGLPAIVTESGDNKFIVENNSNGFIAPISNPQKLGEGMKKVLDLSDAELDIMSARAKETIVKKFDNDTIVNQWIEHYKKGSSY